MEQRHRRSWKHLYRQRQQGLCFPHSHRRNAYSYTYSDSNINSYLYTECDRYAATKSDSDFNCDVNCNRTSKSDTNSFRYQSAKPNTDCFCNCYGDCNGYRQSHSNNHSYRHVHCNTYRECYANSNGNCHSHRFRQCYANPQTDAYRKAAFDTEAASDCAAKAGRTQLIR